MEMWEDWPWLMYMTAIGLGESGAVGLGEVVVVWGVWVFSWSRRIVTLPPENVCVFFFLRESSEKLLRQFFPELA